MTQALERARSVLRAFESQSVTKTIWGSPAGKKRLAERLVALLPEHKTYVESFAGSAAVLFAKEPAELEVINDADPEIAKAYRVIKQLGPDQFARLAKMQWTGDEGTFKRLLDVSPRDDVEWLHRFLYLTHFSYGKMRGRSFSPSIQGVAAKTVARIESFAPRLAKVKVYSGDYEPVVRKYDGKDTVFYLDPPYPGYNVDVGESDFDEERFMKLLKSLKGRFLMTYGTRGKLPGRFEQEGFRVKRIRPTRSIGSMRGVGGPKVLTTLLVSNYELVGKGLTEALGKEWTLDEEVDKRQPFGTFGGSFHYAKRIVEMLPEHETYVEPFAGAAAVLHAKEPSAREVIADIDKDVVFLHRFIKDMDEEKLERLRKLDWTCTQSSWTRVRELEPSNEVERFYKLAFIRGKGRDARPDATHPAGSAMGQTTDPKKYLEAAERLKKVSILEQDYRKTIERFDGAGTFFFIDPPYPGEWYDKEAVVDIEELVKVLGSIRGKFIAVLNDSRSNAAAFKRVGKVFRLKVREASGTGGAKLASRLFCANYDLAARGSAKKQCEDEAGWAIEFLSQDEVGFNKSTALIKGSVADDERFVLGVVLEPEVVDAQGDVYSPEEVRQAAHRFMEEFGGLGLMHRMRVNEQVKLLESYLSPCETKIGDVQVAKGTWLLAVRILDDAIWQKVRTSELTGFSIGGSARRHPESESETQKHDSDESQQLAKASAPSNGPDKRVNRLLDIVVEEVSLVDRAANKHRFLIVKRSDDNEPEAHTVQNANDTELPPSSDAPDGESQVADQEQLASPKDDHHLAALEALEGLTEAVELLGMSGSEESNPRLFELAGELKTVSEQLAALTSSEPDDVEREVPSTGTTEAATDGASLDVALSSVREILERASSALQSATKVSQPAVPTAPASPEANEQLSSQLITLGADIRTLSEQLTGLNQRLVRIEKRFGLPNSGPTGENRQRAEADEDVSWPLDLNRGLSRTVVDKAVSFFEP